MNITANDLVGLAIVEGVKISPVKAKLLIIAIKSLYKVLRGILKMVCPAIVAKHRGDVENLTIEDIESGFDLVKEYEKSLKKDEVKKSLISSTHDFVSNQSDQVSEGFVSLDNLKADDKGNLILMQADWSYFNRSRSQYFTEAMVKLAPENMKIAEGSNPRDFEYEDPASQYGVFEYIPLALMDNGKDNGFIDRGNKSSHLRSTGFQYEENSEHINFDCSKIKAFCIIKLFAGHGIQTVLGISNFVEVVR